VISELRTPDITEADDCAKLIYISGPHLYSYIFVEGEPKIYDLIKLLYNTPGSMIDKEKIVIEEENGRIRGLILAYPASDKNKMAIPMLKSIKGLLLINGLLNLLKMLYRLKLNRHFPGTEDDELFISNIAIFEEYRGKGIATKLLDKAEEMAIEKGLNKLSLYVETDNLHAKRVYEKRGFKEVQKAVLPESYNKCNLYGYYKMVKEINER
jgi:ribosomal protein S18 acetylase RimI-like enzyme